MNLPSLGFTVLRASPPISNARVGNRRHV